MKYLITILLLCPTLAIAADRKVDDAIYESDQPPVRINVIQIKRIKENLLKQIAEIDKQADIAKQQLLEELDNLQEKIDRGEAVGVKIVDNREE